MLNIGGWELMIILLVGLVVLGPQRLPEVARQLGQTVSSLRSLASGFQAELEAASKPITEPGMATRSIDSDAMTLKGPTPQDEAIAATQVDAVAGTAGVTDGDTASEVEPVVDDPIEFVESGTVTADANGEASDPFASRRTDPYEVATAARKVAHDEGEGVSPGGPTDLRDEEE